MSLSSPVAPRCGSSSPRCLPAGLRRPHHRPGAGRRLSLLGLLPAHRRRVGLRPEGLGPDRPADGSVDGWRYAVGDEQSTRFPRAVLTFDADLRRDPGRGRQEARRPRRRLRPPRRRRRRRHAARAQGALRRRGHRRDERRGARRRRRRAHREGLVCAVAGYPASDCGGEVKEVSAEAKAADKPVTIAAPAATPRPAAVDPRRPRHRRAARYATARRAATGGIRHRRARPPRPHRLPRRALASRARPAPDRRRQARCGCSAVRGSCTPQPGGCGGSVSRRPRRARPTRSCCSSSSASASSSSPSGVTRPPPTRSGASSSSARSSSPSAS